MALLPGWAQLLLGLAGFWLILGVWLRNVALFLIAVLQIGSKAVLQALPALRHLLGPAG